MDGSTQIKTVSIISQSLPDSHINYQGKTSTHCLMLFYENSANFQMLAKPVLKLEKTKLTEMTAHVFIISEN